MFIEPVNVLEYDFMHLCEKGNESMSPGSWHRFRSNFYFLLRSLIDLASVI